MMSNERKIEITEMGEYQKDGENKGKTLDNIIPTVDQSDTTKEIIIEKSAETATDVSDSKACDSEKTNTAEIKASKKEVLATTEDKSIGINEEENDADKGFFGIGRRKRNERMAVDDKKSLKPFFIKMGIVYGALFVLLTVGLIIFANFLTGYENSLLKTAANNLLEEIAENPAMILEPSKYEQNYIPTFGELTYQEGLTEIKIKNDGDLIATATFERGEEGSFGFSNYELVEITSLLPTESFSLLIDSDAQVYLNDVLVESDALPITAENEERLVDSPFTLEGVSILSVDELYGEPTVSAKDGFEVVSVEGQNIVSRVLSTEEHDRFLTAATEISNIYARFITKDASKSALTLRLYNGTSFEYDILYFDNSWYISHDSYEFLDESYEILYSVGNVVVAEVSFNYQIRKGSTIYDYPSRYFLYLTDRNGTIEALSIDIKNRD